MSTSLLLGRRLVAGALRLERSTSQNLPAPGAEAGPSLPLVGLIGLGRRRSGNRRAQG
ncbi:MAG TPA: hypothetical protein VN786_01360 [Acidimicrobiales bacterium]|nr:hypothetical protein [Acidimicrobiales bacterium]